MPAKLLAYRYLITLLMTNLRIGEIGYGEKLVKKSKCQERTRLRMVTIPN